MPEAIVLSHVDVAHELGHLEPWLDSGGYRITRLYREDEPTLPAADLLIVLGSPTSVADGFIEDAGRREIARVADWVAADRPYLGICFGAQVLALAGGGTVTRLPETYCGTPTLESDDADVVGPWTLWHNDAISAPQGAVVVGRLAHADLVFRMGNAWGIQPHVEVTPDSLNRMGIALGASDDVRVPLVDALRADETASAERAGRLLARLHGLSGTDDAQPAVGTTGDSGS